MAFGPAVRTPSDASAARWIAADLGLFGTVGGLVPRGYDGYVLFDYRADEAPGWDGVARLFGQLVPLLSAHTSTPEECWFAIWEGYGFATSTTLISAGGSKRERRRAREEDARRNTTVETALDTIPTFDLPNRRYYLTNVAAGE